MRLPFHARIELGLTTVEGHLALWRSGIHHRGVSPANLMYKVEGSRVVGVLIDFDLATRVESVTGNECTGTVPFKALNLLTEEGLAGEIKHVYAYDAESFVWVLVWICLRYDNGELRKFGRRPLDEWLKVDALRCAKEKIHFMLCPPRSLKAGQGHERNWLVAKKCLDALRERLLSRSEISSDAACEGPFEVLLAGPHRKYAAEEQRLLHFSNSRNSTLMTQVCMNACK